VGGPSWLADILAAVMIAIAIYCVSRLVISRAGHRATHHDVDLVHGVMGVAMAGMLVTRLNPLPGSVWAVLFGVATAWFGWQVSRVYRLRSTGRLTSGLATGHYVPHLVMCGAMVYMLLAVAVVKSGSSAGGMAMGGAGGAHFEFLAFILALYMVGYVTECGRPAALSGPGRGGGRRLWQRRGSGGHRTRPGGGKPVGRTRSAASRSRAIHPARRGTSR
jgi:hypothetical protein